MTDEELVKMARLAQRDDRMSTGALYGDLADRIEELEAKLAKALGIGNKMAKSIEGNYYIPGVVKEWRATISDLKQEGSKT
jgi:hypothetical protein